MGEQVAFETWVAARERALLRTAWLLTGDWQHAEDLVQSALVAVWPRWERVCAAGDPEPYVRTVLVRTYTAGRRRLWRREQPSAAPPERASTTDDVGTVDLRDTLLRVLPHLPTGQRAVVVLRFAEDLSEQQTADALGVSVGTVKSQSSKALTRLRAVLGSREDVEGAAGSRREAR